MSNKLSHVFHTLTYFCMCINRYLIKFLSKLTEYQDVNKMTPGNIAIVLGPNLLWMNNEG